MKAHKHDDTQIRLALLEQSHLNIIDTLKDIRTDIRAFREEVKSEFSSVRTDAKSFRDEVRAEFVAIRTEMKSLKDEVKNDIGSLRSFIENKLDRIYNRIWGLFFWMIAGFGSVLYIIAKVSKWLP